MKKIDMFYLAHFNDCTDKPKEQLQLNVQTVNDLINDLENLYPGIAKLLRNEDGTAVLQNPLVLNRDGCRAQFVYDFGIEILDGDNVTLF